MDQEIYVKEIEIDIVVNQLFNGIVGVGPAYQQSKKDDQKLQKQQSVERVYDSQSQLDVKYSVYSERPLTQRRKIRKVENIAWKNLKKTRNDTYVRMLENKIQTLQKQVLRQRQINKSNQDYIKKLSQSEQIISGVFIGRSQIYDRLQKLIDKPQTQEVRKQIIKQISTLRYRSGVQGKDRLKVLNHYFKQMMQMFIPESQKYLVYAACKSVDFFSSQYIETGMLNCSQDDSWRQSIINSMQMNYDQRTRISNFKPTIISEKKKYDQLISNFFNLKNKITQQSKKIEILFDSFKEMVTPFQLSKILVHIEKNKYRKEMNLQSMNQFWCQEFQKDNPGNLNSALLTTVNN